MTENSIKILIVEDEMIIAAKTSMYLNELGYEVMAILPGAEEALSQVQNHVPDIALLDIQLKGKIDGIQLAEIFHREYQIPVVFLTANSDDATFDRAKATKPYAFLTKPFRKLDLKRSLELTMSLLAQQPKEAETIEVSIPENAPPIYTLLDRFFIHENGKMIKLLFDEILYVEAERNYCRIVTGAKKHLLSMPMKSIEGKLPVEYFHRIHRSYIVNLRQVEEVDEGSVIVGDTSLPISKSMREGLLARINKV